MSERLEIIITASDNASGVLGRVGGALGSIGQIASGILTAGLFQRIGQEIFQMGSEALGATASWERMGMSIQTMTARELRGTDSTLSMANALSLAGDKAEETMNWIQRLAIESPFDAEGIGISYRQALTYGFTSEKAKELTQILVDMSAGMGLTSDKMSLVSYALGQINQSDKLLMQDLRQLMAAGVPVNDILKTMGYTLADVSTGAISTKDFISAFTTSMSNDFVGSAKLQSIGWSGLMNSMSDIKKIGLREFFLSTFSAIQPYLANFVAKFSDPAFMETIRKWGEPVGQFVQRLLDALPQVIAFAGYLKQQFDLVVYYMQAPIAQFTTLVNTIKTDIGGLASGIEFPSFGAMVASVTQGIALALWFVNQHWETFKAVIIAVGAVLAGAALVGAITSIAAAVAALATPLGIAIALAALLAVAWAENWGGIQEKTAAVIAWIKNALAAGMQFINDLTSGKLGAISVIWNNLWSGMVTWFTTTIANIKSIFAIFSMAFKGDWEGVGAELRAIWDRTWSAIGQYLSMAWQNLKAIFVELANNIITFFKTTDWAQVGKSIIDGLIAGIKFMSGGGLISAVNGVVDAIKGILTGAFKIKSPSEWAENVVGKNLALGIVSGWNNNLSSSVFAPALATSIAGSGIALPASSSAILGSAGGSTGKSAIVVNFTYSPAMSLGNANEMRDKIAPIMLDLLRQAQINGVI